jgi:peptide/nickel transport system substrate-binding protein
MVRNSQRSRNRIIVAVVLSLGLIAASCGKKDGSDTVATSATVGETATTAATTEETTPVDTSVGDTTPATDLATTTTTTPAPKPVPGGEITISGEAEVENAWIPAAMQCDEYCHQRARTFFEPIASFGVDLKVHPFLAESLTPNADSTQWTIKVRPGISFTDGTPLNADAMIDNLNRTGNYPLVAGEIADLAKIDDPGGATNQDGTPKKVLKIDKADDMTFTIFTGQNGDPSKPLPWPGFNVVLTSQFGLVASPTWLKAVDADVTKATQPVGTGPFIVQSFAPHDALVVTRNPNYWRKDADGVQLPYLDKITFKVIEDAKTAEAALRSGDTDIFSDSSAEVITDFSADPDFTTVVQKDYSETNFLLIDNNKPGPYQDPRVRCALSMAIDRQEIIDLTQAGALQVANGLFSPGQEGHLDDNGFNTDQDIEGAKALIADYQKDHPGPIQITYGHTPDRINAQRAELIKGYWAAIGVDTTVEVIPQEQFVTNVIFGADNFFIYDFRLHSGVTVDQQNFWWNSRNAIDDGKGLSLNFGRIRDPIVDQNLATARSDPDPANRKAAAEAVNRQMAKECYQIPYSYTEWGTMSKPSVHGLGQATTPDGTVIRDGSDFGGWFSTSTLWIDH